MLWMFFLVFSWPGAHGQMENKTFDVNVTYENLGYLYGENEMCHISMDINLEEFLAALRQNEDHFIELEKWLAKVCVSICM